MHFSNHAMFLKQLVKQTIQTDLLRQVKKHVSPNASYFPQMNIEQCNVTFWGKPFICLEKKGKNWRKCKGYILEPQKSSIFTKKGVKFHGKLLQNTAKYPFYTGDGWKGSFCEQHCGLTSMPHIVFQRMLDLDLKNECTLRCGDRGHFRHFIKIFGLWNETLPQTNIDPENGWLEYDRFLLGPRFFQVRTVSFREGNPAIFFDMP